MPDEVASLGSVSDTSSAITGETPMNTNAARQTTGLLLVLNNSIDSKILSSMTHYQFKVLLSHMSFFHAAQTAYLYSYPELEMRNCDKVVFLVQGWIEHQSYSGRYPDIVTE